VETATAEQEGLNVLFAPLINNNRETGGPHGYRF
jgi:hypothetical protein